MIQIAIGEISIDEAAAVTVIDCTGEYDAPNDIISLSGIEHFINLTELDCSYNELNNLDLSKNIALIKLNCEDNELTSLDVSKNMALLNSTA